MAGLHRVLHGTQERSRHTGQGERLPRNFLIGLDLLGDTTNRADLEAFARKLLRDKAEFEHRQMRRREGVAS